MGLLEAIGFLKMTADDGKLSRHCTAWRDDGRHIPKLSDCNAPRRILTPGPG